MKISNLIIRDMLEQDRQELISMMEVFYASPAVLSNGSKEIFNQDIDACLSDSPLLEGYIFEIKNKIAGYAMVAKSFSTEYGKVCIWIEDLYLKENYRGRGIGSNFFQYIDNKYPCGNGGWVHYRVLSEEDLDDAKLLLSAKQFK